MQASEPVREANPRGYKKLVIVVGVLLVLIIAAVYLWYSHRSRLPAAKPLSDTQKAALVQQLDTLSQEAPLTQSQRYEMITGRTLPTASSKTSTPKKSPAKK